MEVLDWSVYKNFTEFEFRCVESGECKMRPEFLDILQAIRDEFDRPIIITSGYRSRRHSKEVDKESPGEHTLGLAADIHVSGVHALNLIHIALDKGILRIGVNQKGVYGGRFVHLGLGDRYYRHLPKGVWTY